MTTVQRSIEINVPVHTLYSKITHFETYPHFMHDVESVQQLDDIHLHWTTHMSDQPVEWNATITERIPDHCIAWHNTTGPTNAGKLELQPTGTDRSRLTLTLDTELEHELNSATNDSESEISLHVLEDLIRLKDFVEGDGTELNATDHRAARARQGIQGQIVSDYAGSEGEASEVSDSLASPLQTGVPRKVNPTQSGYALSKALTDEVFNEPFFVAEELNLDPRPIAMRHLGELPQDTNADLSCGISTSDSVGKAMWQRRADGEDEEI